MSNSKESSTNEQIFLELDVSYIDPLLVAKAILLGIAFIGLVSENLWLKSRDAVLPADVYLEIQNLKVQTKEQAIILENRLADIAKELEDSE